MILTDEEKAVLHCLVDAWNRFTDLPRDDGDRNVDCQEFADAIHRAQTVIALRVARRDAPDVWGSSGVDRGDLPSNWEKEES